MSVSVTMPALGESVTEGTVTRWLKQEGERIEADEPLLEVSTDKVDTEIPSPASGTLASITVGEDETVEVGAQLATIDDGSGGGGDDSGAGESATEQQEEPQDASAQGEQPAEEQQEEQEQAADDQQPEPAQAGRQEKKPAEDEVVQEQAEQKQAEQKQAEQKQAEQKQAATEPVPTPPSQQQQPSTAVAPQPETTSQDQPGEEADAGAYVTPLVRKLAAEHHVDLATLDGTGVGGRIRKQDVLDAAKAAAQPAPSAQEQSPEPAAAAAGTTDAQQPSMPAQAASALRGRTEKMSRLRSVIAQRMVESLQTSAQLTTVVEVDVTKIARLRQRVKADFERREGTKLSFLPFFAVATIEALKAYPNVNASVDTDAGTVTYHDAEHLGVAVDTERGLLVPVIKDAGDLNIGGLARKIADLAERTRTNKITPDELGGGTFTLTNTGSRGALFDTPIINQPQVGILGTGSVVKRAVVVDDEDLGEIVTVRSMVYLALTYDHRIVDGADAARFLGTVKERLENGDFEAQLGL